MDVRLFANNVLPSALLNVDSLRSPLAFRDLIALSAGHDFLLQASNHMCAEAAFRSLHLPWVSGRLDAQAVSALRNSGATFSSGALQRALAAPVGAAGAGVDVLLLFTARDVLFDAVDQCRLRFNVTIALGSLLVVPREPILTRVPRIGEAVQQVINPAILVDSMDRLSQALLVAGSALSPQPPAMRTLSHNQPGLMESRVELAIDRSLGVRELDRHIGLEIDRSIGIQERDRHIDLGNRSSFDVSAWLGGGVLEIPASFAAVSDPSSKTIRVAADVRQSTAKFTDLSHDAALLLSESDPLGLVQTTTQRVRQRGSVALLEDISLVGGSANANAGHLGPLVADSFPCGTGACALNVGATVVPGRVGSRAAAEFIGSSRYGVLWSADAVRLLIRYCWETFAFPRSIPQTEMEAVRLTIDGIEQTADAISVFQLETLDVIELEYDSNGRRDILYTRGKARVVPQLLRLRDGRELLLKDVDVDNPIFAPSDQMSWAALGELAEQSPPDSSPDLLHFEWAVTRGVTSRLGRPFNEPPADAVVTDSRLSAPAQRVALLVN